MNIDNQLDDAARAQMLFKPGPCREVAVAIASAALAVDGPSLWLDEVKLPDLAMEDKNVIGMVVRSMAKVGLIERLEGAQDHRRSVRKGAKGRTVFKYRVCSCALLRTFLERNGAPKMPARQEEFAL